MSPGARRFLIRANLLTIAVMGVMLLCGAHGAVRTLALVSIAAGVFSVVALPLGYGRQR